MADIAMNSGPTSAPAITFKPGTSDAEIEAAAARAVLNRKRLVTFWQLAILVVKLVTKLVW